MSVLNITIKISKKDVFSGKEGNCKIINLSYADEISTDEYYKPVVDVLTDLYLGISC